MKPHAEDLLRLPHSKVSGHDFIVRLESGDGLLLATVASDQGTERLLHTVHLTNSELAPLGKVILDLLAKRGRSPH